MAATYLHWWGYSQEQNDDQGVPARMWGKYRHAYVDNKDYTIPEYQLAIAVIEQFVSDFILYMPDNEKRIWNIDLLSDTDDDSPGTIRFWLSFLDIPSRTFILKLLALDYVYNNGEQPEYQKISTRYRNYFDKVFHKQDYVKPKRAKATDEKVKLDDDESRRKIIHVNVTGFYHGHGIPV